MPTTSYPALVRGFSGQRRTGTKYQKTQNGCSCNVQLLNQRETWIKEAEEEMEIKDTGQVTRW